MTDRDIGSRIRKIRMALGMSQIKLADEVGVSFQQIQKYESGANKVSIERLKKISSVLNFPVGYFIGEEKKVKKKGLAAEKIDKYGEIGLEDLSTEELQLLLKFRAIKNSDIREGIRLLIKGVDQIERGIKI